MLTDYGAIEKNFGGKVCNNECTPSSCCCLWYVNKTFKQTRIRLSDENKTEVDTALIIIVAERNCHQCRAWDKGVEILQSYFSSVSEMHSSLQQDLTKLISQIQVILKKQDTEASCIPFSSCLYSPNGTLLHCKH